jgi:hypothetical protein
MILISLLFVFKGISFLINLSLGKDTWLNVNLFLFDGIQVHFDCIISFPLLVLAVLFPVEVRCIIEFIPDFGI